MSYQIVIGGHSNQPHNEDVKKVAVEAVEKLKALGHLSVSLSGYTNDETGSEQLVDALVPSNGQTSTTEEAPTETAAETGAAE